MSPGSGAKEPLRGARPELGAANPAADKPRFDFYKILPGGDEPKAAPDRRAVDKGAERPADKLAEANRPPEAASLRSADRFWLQAGAFSNAADAEDLKARLALSGWEAAVQPVAMADKTQRYRVRLGPYDNTDELNRVKKELGSRGFDVAVVKNP